MTQRIRPGTVAALALLLAAATGCTGQQPQAPVPSAPPTAAAGAGGQDADVPRPFTLLASGDVLPHTSDHRPGARRRGRRGLRLPADARGRRNPWSSGADLAICHMETVYGADGGPYTGYPSFKSPPQVADGLAATGYDSCSTASNHTLDDGRQGIAPHARTPWTGRRPARRIGPLPPPRRARPTLLRGREGAKVAHLAYTYGTNDIPLPAGTALGRQPDRRRADRGGRAGGPAGGRRRRGRVRCTGAPNGRTRRTHRQLSLAERAHRVPHRRAAPTST